MNEKREHNEFPAIAHNLRNERQKRNWTLQQLADGSGISKAMLSQIEANKVNPTVATLWKIAQALQIDLDRLLLGKRAPRQIFEISSEPQQLHLAMDEGKTMFNILSPPNLSEELEIYRVALKGGGVHVSQPHAKNTVEFVTVQEGCVEVSAGEKRGTLSKGDCIMMQTDTEHSLRNLSKTDEAILFMVVRFAETK